MLHPKCKVAFLVVVVLTPGAIATITVFGRALRPVVAVPFHSARPSKVDSLIVCFPGNNLLLIDCTTSYYYYSARPPTYITL